MSRSIPRTCSSLFLVHLVVIALGFATAAAAQLSGSYKVIQKTDVGSQTRLRLQLHLNNRGSRDLYIQELALWNSPRSPKGNQPISLLIHRGGSADTTQELTVPRGEYTRWRQTLTLRILLGLENPQGRNTTELVRLDRVSSGKAN